MKTANFTKMKHMKKVYFRGNATMVKKIFLRKPYAVL